MNMWDKTPKPKFLYWKDRCKTVRFMAYSEAMRWRPQTRSLFACNSPQSSGDLDLEDNVCKNEFSYFNATLMRLDGSLLPCSSKSLPKHDYRAWPQLRQCLGLLTHPPPRAHLTKARHPDSHLPSVSLAWLWCLTWWVFTNVWLVIITTFQHSSFPQLTPGR